MSVFPRVLILCTVLGGLVALAGEGKSEPVKHAPPKKKTIDKPALEEAFRRKLTNAVLRGSWQMTRTDGKPSGAKLSEPQTDQYTISKVTKLANDYWLVHARVQYGDKDVTLPVPVRVVWAEELPIITLDKMNLPGLGTYAAHVMIDGDFYGGTWFGAEYGGVMSGQIVALQVAGKLGSETSKESDSHTGAQRRE